MSHSDNSRLGFCFLSRSSIIVATDSRQHNQSSCTKDTPTPREAVMATVDAKIPTAIVILTTVDITTQGWTSACHGMNNQTVPNSNNQIITVMVMHGSSDISSRRNDKLKAYLCKQSGRIDFVTSTS